MTFSNPTIEEIKEILKTVKHIAIVGISDKPERASFQAASYLQSHGYKIFPVNPILKEVLGEKVYPTLQDIQQKVDIAVIFRRPEEVLVHMKEVLRRGGIKTVWLQEGVNSVEAEDFAQDYGIDMVTNFCIMEAHKKMEQYQI